MLLPALVVLSDEAVLRAASANRWSTASNLYVLAWFVFQTGLLSYVAGWRLPTWPWRLLLLGWTLLLVDLLLPATTTYAGGSSHIESLQHMLGRAFLTGQIASLTVWVVLSGVSLMSRLALVLVAALLATHLASSLEFRSYADSLRWGGNEVWTVIVIAQISGVAAMALLLRLRGFRIEPLNAAPTSRSSGPMQFSVRHLIIATTFAAILTFGVQRAVEASSHTLFSGQWVHASVVGALLSLVSLAALWMTLGVGRWPSKVLIFAIPIAAVGASLDWLESNLEYAERWGSLMPLTNMGDLWPAWTLLTGSFLAGMLLVLRGSGFRLARKARSSDAA